MSEHPFSRNVLVLKTGMKLRAGTEDYVLGGAIGDGAAGVVRKATRLRDGVVVAIKTLAPDPKYIDSETFDDVASRFRREGERGLRLDHPHLVRLLAFEGNEDGICFPEAPSIRNPLLVMEYLPGSTLEGFIKRLQPDEQKKFMLGPKRLLLAIQIVSALEYLHKRKHVHRDVKPANIFLSSRQGQVPKAKLGDFGIMKWGDFHGALASGTLTATSQKGLGTLKYMSPEQALRPKEVTARSDIWPLGITLFELVTGQHLAGPHQVFEVMLARLARGTTQSRWRDLGYAITTADDGIASLILDMHLRGQDGRPASDKLLGRLSWEYETRFGHPWQEALEKRAFEGEKTP